jgi:putative nucleotidyltransferase with HDIG domain
MSMSINLNHAVSALSDALDLVGIDDVRHGKRVGYMAFRCGEAMGLDQAACERLFRIGMLHDCGVSSTRVHRHLTTEMQWKDAHVHAEAGAVLLGGFPPLADLAEAVRYHHTPWQELNGMDRLDASIRIDANLIFLTDRTDVLCTPYAGVNLLENATAIRSTLQGLAGSLFSPDLLEAFTAASRSEAFWMTLEPSHLDRFLADMSRSASQEYVPFDQVRPLARLFSLIVDAKSPYTYRHSIGVAQLARYLAERLGLDAGSADKIEVAGLLHDLGKLRVPDEVLDKAGALDARDLKIMHRHSFESYQVLRGIEGFEDIALWAAYHHETLDGEGYPFQRRGAELPVEARIVTVADVFQALAQDRPYRPALGLDRIKEILGDLAQRGRLDSDIVALVVSDADRCLQLATGPGNIDGGSGPH